MRILSVTAGAGGMYCGSCSRDNALAVELMARGHTVTLLPLYTPTNPDETNASRNRVLFGGISVYLQQRFPFFRKIPRAWDRIWDSPAVIRAVAGRSISTDPRMLGDLTVSMLEGYQGVLRKEFDKLLDWLADEAIPDVVNLPNSLLLGLAGPLRDALKCPITCTLQGEDLFLDALVEPFHRQAIDLIRRQARYVDRFIAVSHYYVPKMAKLLAVQSSAIAVVPLGISMNGFERRDARGDEFRVGYFARIAPEKGLHLLAAAYPLFRRRAGHARVTLHAAGYMSREREPYLAKVRRTLAAAGVGHEFTYHGAMDRGGKVAFLRGLDVFSVPTTYDEPKGMFLLEAMASGVPVVQPRRGAFPEMIEATGGGVLVAPDNPEAVADGLYSLWRNRSLARTLGEQAFQRVRTLYSVQQSAGRLLDVYESLVASQGAAPRRRAAQV